MEINLTQGRVAVIDDEDYELVSLYKWRAQRIQNRWYAYAWRPYPYLIAMHRLIMNPPDVMLVDHINHDGLDNRRSNLRVCTNSINQHNRPDVKGYYFEPHRGKYHTKITVDGKSHFLGRFPTEKEARTAYLLAKQELVFGDPDTVEGD